MTALEERQQRLITKAYELLIYAEHAAMKINVENARKEKGDTSVDRSILNRVEFYQLADREKDIHKWHLAAERLGSTGNGR